MKPTKEQSLKMAADCKFSTTMTACYEAELHTLCQRVEEMAFRKAADECDVRHSVMRESGGVGARNCTECRDAILALINQKEGT